MQLRYLGLTELAVRQPLGLEAMCKGSLVIGQS